jgi:predicted transposase YbfD/YdcC
LHTVSAWGCEQRLVLAQIATDAKSNEITAVPKLLEMLRLKGTIVTADALNCQRAIAQQIVDQGGDYALALKGNQGTLHDDVVLYLDDPASKAITAAPVVDADHGRIETRTATVSTDIAWLSKDHRWPGLFAVGKVEQVRETAGKTTSETAYYLLCAPLTPERFNEVVRSHWGVDNRLHWRLDVVMNEDQEPQPLGKWPPQSRRSPPHGLEHHAERWRKRLTPGKAQTSRMERSLPCTAPDPVLNCDPLTCPGGAMVRCTMACYTLS